MPLAAERDSGADVHARLIDGIAGEHLVAGTATGVKPKNGSKPVTTETSEP